MRNFWADFSDFESKINIIKCKTEKPKQKNLNILMQDCRWYLGKGNLMQKICKRGPQSSEIFGQKFQCIYHLGKFALVKILEGTLLLMNCSLLALVLHAVLNVFLVGTSLQKCYSLIYKLLS